MYIKTFNLSKLLVPIDNMPEANIGEMVGVGPKGRNFDGVISLTLLMGYEPEMNKNGFIFKPKSIHGNRIETG
jgi:hypothetical protein